MNKVERRALMLLLAQVEFALDVFAPTSLFVEKETRNYIDVFRRDFKIERKSIGELVSTNKGKGLNA